jgi:hypothetical protein
MFADPHQHPTILIHSETFSVDQISLEVFDVLIIDIEAAFEHSIGYSTIPL